jgi:hypothetical protein
MPDVVDEICSHSGRQSPKGVHVDLDDARPRNSSWTSEYLCTNKVTQMPYAASGRNQALSTFLSNGDLEQNF